MNKRLLDEWKAVVPRIELILDQMKKVTIIDLGSSAYSRIIPSTFLGDKYQIYVFKNSMDIELLRRYASVFTYEEKFPKNAHKIRSMGYLLGNFGFQSFLQSRRGPFRLMFRQISPGLETKLQELGLEYIGNPQSKFNEVLVKGSFRNLLKQLNLPHLPDWYMLRTQFLETSFDVLWGKWQKPVVVQRADRDVEGKKATFFIYEEKDLKEAIEILKDDDSFNEVIICPFIESHPLSMLGCITHLGVLTTALQLQLIDIPEALNGSVGTGNFIGHDWGFKNWPSETEKQAQKMVETLGEYLGSKGYKGVFGIDFVYDIKTREIYPIECNPRFTGASPVYSLMTLKLGKVPPIEFFHIMSQLGINESFDFDTANNLLKETLPVSHVGISPEGMEIMQLPLRAGIYSYDPLNKDVNYERAGAFLDEMQSENEFILIDTVYKKGTPVPQHGVRAFKMIFPKSVATSSKSLKPEIAEFIKLFSHVLKG